jgi:hypothetical protein
VDTSFPSHRKAKWNVPLLKKLGMTVDRIKDHDALFFELLLKPIENDLDQRGKRALTGREAFWAKVERYTQNYMVSKGLAGSYQGNAKLANVCELVRMSGQLLMHGALGGNKSCKMAERFKPSTPEHRNVYFSEDIAEASSYTRLVEVFPFVFNWSYVSCYS